MYTQHFNLSAPPFQLTPDPRFLFESSVHARAIAHLQYGLQQGEGFIVVTGDVGAGKTTIIGHLLDSLDRHKYVATTVVTTNINPDDIIRMIAHGLSLPHDGRDKAHLLLDIEAYLHECVRRNKRVLIFVDEAQNLDIPTLEELRMLSNIHVNGIAPVQLFLLGQPQFRSTMSLPDLRQLRQRVIASYHLGPLDAEETRDYILHRLTRVGWDGEHPTLRDDAFPAIYKYTEGVPRRINTLCSRILLFCCLEENNVIDFETVMLVAQDLEEEFAQVLDQGEPTYVENVPQTAPVQETPPATPQPAETPQPIATAPAAPETVQELAPPSVQPPVLEPTRELEPTLEPQPVTEPVIAAVPEPEPKPEPELVPTTASETGPTLVPEIHSIPEPDEASMPLIPSEAAATLSHIASNLSIPEDIENNLSQQGWQEVFDIIESTPVEALAALGQHQASEEDAPSEGLVETSAPPTEESLPDPSRETTQHKNIPEETKAHNKMFKRLLLLILEEYMKGRPNTSDRDHNVQHLHSR